MAAGERLAPETHRADDTLLVEPQSAGLRLPVWSWLVAWMGVWVGGSVLAHLALHGVVNGWHVLLSIFLGINVMICIWEISLWHRIDEIERWFHNPGTVDEAGEGRPKGNLYLKRVSLRELASTRLWALVWYGYAYYDPSYADRRSFGFAIDVGNGFSTLIPSLLFHVGMTLTILSPVWLGIVGGLIFYQKFYGTCLYFFSYLFNRRYEGHRLSSLVAMVGGTNGIWLVFPAFGLYVCARLILDDSFAVIRG
jgi:hypothetical protein